MTRKRILSMLVLLVMAVTGAWAQEQSETITTTANIVEGTHFTISNNDNYADTDGMSADKGITVTAKNGETITKVVISCTFQPGYVNDGNTIVSSGTKEITNGGGTITVTGVNASTFTFTCSENSPQFGQFVVYYTTEAPAGPTGYTVSMKEGTEDATSWTIAPPEATTTGVAQGTEVTATYSGTKKVKSVKAKKAATAPAAAIAPALMDGATVLIEYNCDGFVTYFTFTNNGGTYSCDITGDESEGYSASLTKQGNTLVFVAHHSDIPDSFDSTINFDTTSDTYSFAKKTEEFFYFKISVNGTDITDKLSEVQ